MRTLFWLLILMGVPSQLSAQEMPFMPDPPSMGLPNCPVHLMGTSNGIFYYATSDCSSGTSGYGQSTTDLTGMLSCCVGSECKPGCQVTPTFSGTSGSGLKTMSSLPTCDPKTMTLQEAVDQCQARLDYLDTLSTHPEVANRTKGRISGWRGRVQAMLNYLNNNGQPEADRISNYCTKFVPKDAIHEYYWSHAVLELQSRKQVISGIPQPSLPLQSEVLFDAKGSGASPKLGPLLKINVTSLQGGNKTVFFQTIVVTDGARNFRIGLEVDPTGVTEVGEAKFVDRHKHGHLIQATSGPNPGVRYLVSSYTNLEIEQ